MIEIFTAQSAAAKGAKAASKLTRHLLSSVFCQERHTITGLLKTAGRQQHDWSADYRLYQGQVEADRLFEPIVQGALEQLPGQRPVVVAVDDSLLGKTGTKIPRVGWYRDPLGPPFHTNLVRALKFVQLSVAVPDCYEGRGARMVPVGFAPIAKMPKVAAGATEKEKALAEQRRQANSPSHHALGLIEKLRGQLDGTEEHRHRSLYVCGDGHYSTETMLQQLPAQTHYIGRIRGDTHLCEVAPPKPCRGKGRPASYGPKLPTPEELRKDKTVSWKELTTEKNGQATTIRYKHLPQARWHIAGEKALLQVVVIAPFRYKKKMDGPWRYTQPAYLLCTDASLPVADLIRWYLWRWDIEVNFRDEKQLFGASQPQVRHPISVAVAPAVCIAAYAGLLLAAIRIFGTRGLPIVLSPPKWHRRKSRQRPSTATLLQQLRHEVTAQSLCFANFSGFCCDTPQQTNPDKSNSPSPPPSQRTAA